jgi:predicted lipid-binding transport protein (Tim44 family)
MNKLVNAVFAVVIGFVLGIADAEAAKRVGGGRSVGTQREAVKQQQVTPSKPAQAPQAAPGAAQAAPAAAGAAGAGRWFGPIAGLLAGGLLGAMLFGGAFEGFKFMDFAMILLLAAAVFFIFRMLRKPNPAQARPEPMQYAGVGAEPRIEPSVQPQHASAAMPAAAAPVDSTYFPAGFDAETFAAQSKRNFVRLQEANDRGDLSSLRDVMTPQLYREIEAQFRERGGAAQKTEIVTLDAKVVEVVSEGANYIASVRFTGMIKEDGAQPEHFSELWHLQKPLKGSSGWLVAGIQQD